MIQTVLVLIIFAATLFALLRKPILGVWSRIRYSRSEREAMARTAAINRLKNGVAALHDSDSSCGPSCHCSFQPGKPVAHKASSTV